jgi:hypothetical protein
VELSVRTWQSTVRVHIADVQWGGDQVHRSLNCKTNECIGRKRNGGIESPAEERLVIVAGDTTLKTIGVFACTQ